MVKQVKRSRTDAHDYSMDPGETEIDNHADTHCFGKNFKPLYFTSEVCSVSPFLDEYNSQDDVPICSAATAVDLDQGQTLILVFGQGLWFGNRMDKSLINPNQCRAYGIGVCDDPTDPHRELGIYVDDDDIIPLSMSGSTCGLTSRAPTDEELHTCKTLTMCDEQHWDPTEARFFRNVSSVEGGKRYSAGFSSSIMAIKHAKCDDTLLYSNDTHIHDFDRAMSQVSTGLAEELMIDELCNHVNILATYTEHRHHGSDPHLLARKWGIGINKA